MQMNCMNCDHRLICRNADDDKNHVCSMYDPIFHKTNADRIRKMSDDELAEWLDLRTDYRTEDWLVWLKEEVDT